MCKDFWCIWSSSYNWGDPAFTYDENCYECDHKWQHGCCLCGHYFEEEGGCEYEIKPEDVVKPYAKLMGYEVRKPHEKIKDLKPGYTFFMGSNHHRSELIKFDEIDNKPLAIIKNSITSGYSVVSVTKPVYDVKEN